MWAYNGKNISYFNTVSVRSGWLGRNITLKCTVYNEMRDSMGKDSAELTFAVEGTDSLEQKQIKSVINHFACQTAFSRDHNIMITTFL